MLDMDFGFFPYVTYGNTTSKNAMEMIEKHLVGTTTEVTYVTRCYATRHGVGSLPNRDKVIKLAHVENETNTENEWQGRLHVAPLCTDMLDYALLADSNFTKDLDKNLMITCLDQVETSFPIVFMGQAVSIEVHQLQSFLDVKFSKIFKSHQP